MTLRILWLAPLTALLLSLGGCATPHVWEKTNANTYSPPSQGYAVTLPQGWLEDSSPDWTVTLLTRHGSDLDSIRIIRYENDKAFPETKKGATPGESPGQLADDMMAEIKAESGITGFQIITNEPGTLGGQNGVHLLTEFSDTEGVHYRQDDYLVCNAVGTYLVTYRAPVLHFYDLYHPAFQALVHSFQFVANQGHAR
ncbi:MAG TPA: hypothetical protein VGM16_08790 [Gammaproteobacteria bacterium]|jgi:hypothetical protein